MYVARVDVDVLKSEEMHKLWDQYEAKFGKHFVPFNYENFHRVGDKCAAEMYKEALIEALNAEPASACADEYDL